MPELVDYAVTYGECAGYCTAVLSIDGSGIELVRTSSDPDGPALRYAGEIDRDLREAIAAEVESLEPGRLRRVYGEPDARDEGAVTVRTGGPGGTTAHSYSRGSPPRELADLDALLSPILFGWIDGEAPVGVRLIDVP
jgi:hypothetical protein